MTKEQLRSKYKSLRKTLDHAQKEDFSLAIANKLLDLDIWKSAYYHLFLTIDTKNEIDTDYILHILQGKDKHVVISKSNFSDYSLSHYLLTDSTVLKLNSFNVPEPEDGIEVTVNQIEVVFIPLLAFDLAGNRVGYGKGYYDRFLSACNATTLKIGLSYFDAEPIITDIGTDDVKLDYCVTPHQIYRFH